MRSREKGVSVLFVVIALLLIAAAALAFIALTRTKADVDRSVETTAHLAKVQVALEQFASAAERLPCPANPALDTGDAEPNAASASCTYPAGTVPWRTIGLKREDSLDAWGWKIGYRVYQGATGLTQAGGASMVHCDLVEPAPAGTAPGGLCQPSHNTSEAQFLAGKGLAVSAFGTSVTDAAYVLVSHGPTGLGAYTSSGGQKQPNPTSANELANLGATGPFIAKAAVTDVAPDAATFFDDVIAYRRIRDFVKLANLAARDWPETAGGSLVNLTFDQATVSAAVGSSVAPGSSTGQQTVTFSNASVTAFDNSGNQNVSFDNAGGYPGIGGAGGNPMLTSAAGEGVRIDLSLPARQVGVTFADFGRRPGNVREQAELKFFDGATLLATVVAEGCKNDGDIATFSLAAPADFDRIEIKPLPATTDGSDTAFLLAQLVTCAAAGTCLTSLSAPSNLCT
jgi:Tfp pilus assembly protein PilV